MIKQTLIFRSAAGGASIALRFVLLVFLVFGLILNGIKSAAADEAISRNVFLAEETEPFGPDTDTLDVYVAPLLGADCMLLGTDGEWMLVDMGKEKNTPVINVLLDKLGVKKIAIAFNTHPHSDHIGGMAQLAKSIDIGRFITVFPLDYTGPNIKQRSTVRALQDAGVPVEVMADGSQFSLGRAEIQVMKTNMREPNASSAVLRVQFGGTAFLLAADVNRLAQQRLAASHELSADVLKYPHHGLEKLDESFTRAVNLEFAVFTHGAINTKEGQKCLDSKQIAYRFATWGTLHFQSDGQKIIVSQELNEVGLHMQAFREKKK